MCNNVLTIDVEDRVRKFNMAAYDALLNTSDLIVEVIRCELILKNVYLYCYMELVVFQLPIVTRKNYTLLLKKYTDTFLRRRTCQCIRLIKRIYYFSNCRIDRE